MISDTLLAAKAALENSTLYAKWKRDNPKEFARVENYWANGGVFPQTVTAFGLHYALDARAYWESLPVNHSIAVPPASAGADTPPIDGADVSLFPIAASALVSGLAGVGAADLSLPFVPV